MSKIKNLTKNKKILALGILIILSLFTIVGGYLLSQNASTDTRSDASNSDYPPDSLCNNPTSTFKLQTSNDGINFSERTSMFVNFNQRIYIKLSAMFSTMYGQVPVPCSNNFSLGLGLGEATTPQEGNFVFLPKYGSILTDPNTGIARLDWDSLKTKHPDFVKDGNTYQMRLYFYNENKQDNEIVLGNPILITSTSNPVATTPKAKTYNLAEYLNLNPGNTYIYESKNYLVEDATKQTGLTRLQMEQPVSECGYTIKPWRFTKNNKYVYWGTYSDKYKTASTYNYHNGTRDMRWMFVDANFDVNTNPYFSAFDNLTPYANNYNSNFWVRQDKTYINGASPEPGNNLIPDGFYNFNPTNANAKTALYNSRTGEYPAYYIGPKTSYLPHTFRGTESRYDVYDANQISSECKSIVNDTEVADNYKFGWRLRIEPDTFTTFDGVTFDDVLRYDFYEGNNNLEESDYFFFRETYYFAKGIGLVGIEGKHFNQTLGIPGNTYCHQDTDCTGDEIKNPHFKSSILYYNLGEAFQSRVSLDNLEDYNSQLVTVKLKRSDLQADKGYYFKMYNENNQLAKYSGLLEAQIGNPIKGGYVENRPGFLSYNAEILNSLDLAELNSKYEYSTIFKWTGKVDNGIAHIKGTELASLPAGKYVAKFRIYVPDEQFPGETRIPELRRELPFSNPIMVEIVEG